jgi:RNA-dependent RNA polymerase
LREGEARTVKDLTEDINDPGPTASDFDEIQIRVDQYVRASEYTSMEDFSVQEVQEAWDLFQTFTGQIHNACVSHTLSQSRDAMLTEQELIVGTIVAKSSQPRKRKDTMAKASIRAPNSEHHADVSCPGQMREVTSVIVRDARDELKGDDTNTYEQWLRRSYVAWRLANLEEESFGGKSFW